MDQKISFLLQRARREVGFDSIEMAEQWITVEKFPERAHMSVEDSREVEFGS